MFDIEASQVEKLINTSREQIEQFEEISAQIKEQFTPERIQRIATRAETEFDDYLNAELAKLKTEAMEKVKAQLSSFCACE